MRKCMGGEKDACANAWEGKRTCAKLHGRGKGCVRKCTGGEWIGREKGTQRVKFENAIKLENAIEVAGEVRRVQDERQSIFVILLIIEQHSLAGCVFVRVF